MPIKNENFGGGLVTARDPMLLGVGELQRASDCIYKPNDPAIWKAPGRAEYNTVAMVNSTTPIKGLRYLEFDNSDTAAADNFIVAHTEDDYRRSIFTDESTNFFSFDTGVGTGDTLEAVQYNNRYYMLNGNTGGINNRVLGTNITDSPDQEPTARRHGLDPVIDAPTVATNTGAGWPGVDKDFGDDNYFFFTVEVVNPITGDEPEGTVTDEVESTFTGTPAIHAILGSDDGVTITAPVTATNSSATHWRVYMHGPTKADEWGGTMFSNSWRVSDNIPIATTTANLGAASSSQVQNTMTATQTVATWTNVTNAQSCDKSGATSAVKGAQFEATDFGFSTGGITGTIQGIKINVKSKKTNIGRAEIDVAVSKDEATYPISYLDGPFVNHYDNVFFGSANELWGTTWVAGDFANTKFSVRVTYQDQILNSATIDIDCIEATVYYGGANEIVRGQQFPAVSIQVSNLLVSQGANDSPPVASTGDIFEGQLVLNDVEDASIIRYSLPDGVDYFPFVYFLNFETRNNDKVKHIRRLGNKLIVGTEHKLFRVNYLPRNTDAEFDRGRAYEEISADHGIISTQGAALFTPPGKPQLLAYVATNGLHMTDGYQTDTITEDLDWENMINVQKLSSCILVNFPKYSSLVFYYIPADDTTSTYPTRSMWLNYHSSQIKENGKLKVSGPQFKKNTAREIPSATTSRLSGEVLLMTGLDNGQTYVEDRGYSDSDDDVTGGIEPDIVSREIYLGGPGQESTISQLYTRHYEHDPVSTVTVKPYYRNLSGDPILPSTTWTAKTFTTADGAPVEGGEANLNNGGTFDRTDMNLKGESHTMRYQGDDSGNGMALSMFTIKHTKPNPEEER